MPPKRGRQPKATTASSKPTTQPPKKAATRAKRSKISKTTTTTGLSDHSAQSDAEILRTFSLFAVTRADAAADHDEEVEDDEDEGEAVIKIADIRRCLSTLNIPKPPSDFFDDQDQPYLTRPEFLQLAQTLRETLPSSGPSSDDHQDDGDYASPSHDNAAANQQDQEITHAFSLFTHARQGNNVRITLADLKRVAAELREEVDEGTLKLMIEEANGEGGKESVGRGVGVGEFEEVMRRAGVFG